MSGLIIIISSSSSIDLLTSFGILVVIIIIIIEGLSLLQSIPPTTADKQTQAQKRSSNMYVLFVFVFVCTSIHRLSLVAFTGKGNHEST